MSDKKRNPYFDFLRAVAIIMVIANHTSSSADLDMSNGFNFNVLMLQAIKPAVPIFLAISGFFLCKVIINDRQAYFRFQKKHLAKIYIPMMLFSLPYIFGNGLAIRPVAGRTLLALAGAYSVYYFIFLIAQYYVLLPVITSAVKRIWGRVGIAGISAVAIVTMTYLNVIKGLDLPLYIYAGLFPVWLVFFAMGCYLRTVTREYKLMPLLLCTLLTLGLSYVETYYLTAHYNGGYGIKLSVFMFSACVISLLFSNHIENFYNRYSEHKICRIFEKIGRLSFFIYLTHVYIIRYLGDFDILFTSWWLNIVLVSVICTIIGWAADKLLPSKAKYVVGLT